MNILNRLTIKNLKLNKKRTVVTIIGIILSTALICAVAGMVSSLQQTLINNAIDNAGNRHVTVYDVPNEDVKYFVNDRHVKSYYLSENIGYAKADKSENQYKPYLYIKSYTEDGFKNASYKLDSGRLPKDVNEIVLPVTINENGHANYKIGDTLSLQVGKRILLETNEELNQYTPLIPDEEGGEEIVDTITKEYTIVGFIKRANVDIEGFNSPGYTSLTYMDAKDASKDVSLLFKDPKYAKTFLLNLKNDDKDYFYSQNADLLRWQLVNLSSSTMLTLVTVASVVIGIIILTSIFVIRNSFNISISEKTKQYGMLASIGATSKQIKKNVLYEGFIIGLFGIPIGILSGMFADFVLVMLINYLLGPSLGDMEFVYKIPILPIVITFVLASITIYLSVISAARKSSKISPIEAIRSQNDIKIKAKKLKTPKIIQKIFKMGGVIAYKNLKRSRKKYRTTVISLVVSISIFISLSSFITYGFKMSGIYYKEYPYNVDINVNTNGEETKETIKDIQKIYQDIVKMDFVDQYSIHNYAHLKIDAKNITTDESFYNIFGEDKKSAEDTFLYLSLVSLGKDEYERYVKELKKDINDVKDGGILLDTSMVYNKEAKIYEKVSTYTLLEGDSFTGLTGIKEESDHHELTIPIVAKTDVRPTGLDHVYTNSGILIVSDEMLESIGIETTGSMFIESSNPEKLIDSIKEYQKSQSGYSFYYTNLEEIAKQENSMILLIAIFLYGFIIVISLIGVTNIFNTITTNMTLRQKEFAMLKSVGMTSKEFNRMIILESIFYCSKALFIGIPLGLIGSYLLFRSFGNTADFGFILPVSAIIISIVAVFFLVGLIMHYSFKKINKQNIIETIRKDNI